MIEEPTPEEIAEAQRACWNDGDLSFLLDDNQLEMQHSFRNSKSKYYVIECARRLGKSYYLCIEAVEFAIKHPRARILYAAPTNKDAQEIIAPLLEQICESAPFRVKFDKNQSKFIFPNGAQIRLFGCDNKTKANRGRGSGANLVLIDEAGFIPTLDYVLHSIVAPQTLTTRGRVILASTPSDEPDHPFTALAEQAESKGYYVRKTLQDNPRLTQAEIDQYIADDAAILGFSIEEFKQSDVYKREFLALRAIDTNLVVCPEWHGGFTNFNRPEFFDAYVALDLGGVDPHGVLFGFWDYATQELFIEDELLLRDGQNTEELVEAIKKKETFLWGTDKWDGTLRAAEEKRGLPEWLKPTLAKVSQPYLRVCDMGGPKVELRVDGVTFIPTAKVDKWQAINSVRVMFREKKIHIHPRCKNLDRHLRGTMWLNEKTTSYRRKNGEHGDLLDCLVYMARNIRKTKDARPLNYGVDGDNIWIRPPEKQADLMPSWVGKL
ncbi:MAG: hypothetical protein IPJ65_38290 [Archangiaceae bacterium]|nr:hypothetical protein [Archangiaceae bacterium]